MTTGSGSLRDAQKARTRANIIEAARVVFEQNGYAGTSIGVITAEASINRATFYLHFADKAAVFREVVAIDRMRTGTYWAELDRVLVGGTRDGISRWIRRMTQWAEDNASLMPARHEAMASDPEFAKELQPRFDRLLEQVGGYIETVPVEDRPRRRAQLQMLMAMLDQTFLHAWVQQAWTIDKEQLLEAATDIWCSSLDVD